MSRRRFAAILVLLAWFASLGALARRRHLADTAPNLATAPRRLPPGSQFFSVKLGDQLVGLASMTVDTTPGGIRVVQRYDLTLPGPIRTARYWTDQTLSRGFSLDSFAASIPTGNDVTGVEGAMRGDSLLVMTMGAAGHADSMLIPVKAPLVLPSALSLRAVVGARPAVGKTFDLTVLDPLTLSIRPATLRITAESLFVVPDSTAMDSTTHRWVAAHSDTVPAYRLEEDGVPGVRWVDPEGYLLAEVTPEGYHLQRTAFELVNEAYREVRGTGVKGAPLVAGRLTTPPPVRATMAVLLNPRVASDSLLAGDRQRVSGDTLFIERDPELVMRDHSAINWNVRRRWAVARRDPAPGIPSDDPELAARARRILRGSHSPNESVRRLSRWVADHIAQTTTPGTPQALTAFRLRRGDDAAHALLFVAMVRAVGMSARPVSGVVAVRGRWRWHAWAEVWMGQWIAVDPTWGQFPAEASSVRLSADGIAPPVLLLPLAARLGAPLDLPTRMVSSTATAGQR
ncbi:MAG TPA: transglutaminase-like domain-containing protein [Gemmatimonadales bacterium]|nr:transglutaminase-like domain-containing protein [Gemmatimonadales bacterium]